MDGIGIHPTATQISSKQCHSAIYADNYDVIVTFHCFVMIMVYDHCFEHEVAREF